MDARRNVDVDAHIEILKLGVDQRIDADSADSGLERTGCYGHAIADLQRGLLPVQRPNLRVLDDLGVAVAHNGRRGNARNADVEIGGVQIANAVQVDAAVRTRATARASAGSRPRPC